jgi:pyridoxal phosphate enzyme (YggS family)
MSVKENISQIRSEIPNGVTLVAVSKTKPDELIMEAYEAGHRDFGENYVQELVDKHEQLPKDIRWHFIGHLQSNKVKYIAPFVHLIHSVDSFKLLKEVNKQAQKNNRVIDCLLQIYIAQEETKFGLDEKECEDVLRSEEFKTLSHVKVIGFMGMASNTENKEQVRKEFKSLKTLFDKLSTLPTTNSELRILSFGMSSDYKIAIEEGSNMLRIGSTIFGERNYSKD